MNSFEFGDIAYDVFSLGSLLLSEMLMSYFIVLIWLGIFFFFFGILSHRNLVNSFIWKLEGPSFVGFSTHMFL